MKMYYEDGNYAPTHRYVLQGFSALGDILDIREYAQPVPLFIAQALAMRMFKRPQIETIYLWEEEEGPFCRVIRRR